ncbi:MAG: hypothetical protein HQK70_00755 [Desulfamplus sp.]|nr:hypothetical protein [Desulfamplus sp.]
MKNNHFMEIASKSAERVYVDFLKRVVEGYIVNGNKGKGDRETVAIEENARKKIESGQYVDPRTLRLMAISGKGGKVALGDDPAKQAKYDRFTNITLLDHLLSVTRGGVVFCAMDLMAQNSDMNLEKLQKRLAVVAVIAFLHDIDKDIQLERNADITLAAVEERVKRYGINEFLKQYDVALSSEEILCLIAKVEATQSHRYIKTLNSPLPREFETLTEYIRFADHMDGVWLLDDPSDGGISGVLKNFEEKKHRNIFKSDVLDRWKKIEIFDPHHSFLLDELQSAISDRSVNVTGIPPLIEIHQDGHLIMLVPENGYDTIIDKAFKSLSSQLPFSLQINISNRGIPALYNGFPSHEEIESFISKTLQSTDFSDLFKIKKEFVEPLNENLDNLLSQVGLQPVFPSKKSGALITLYSSLEKMEENSKEHLYRAAHLVLLLNLNIESKPKDNIPDYNQREKNLLELIKEPRPSWINEIDDAASRRTVTALWVTALAYEDDEMVNKIWEEGGLLQKWLEGDEENKGFNNFIEGDGVKIKQEIISRFKSFLTGEFIAESDTADVNDNKKGRCLFTDEPVPFDQTISEALGLYGVKVSAFSGRDGRPESIMSGSAHTNISLTSVAEHKIRTKVHEIQKGRAGGVPTIISSPSTIGLFGGLGLNVDKSMRVMSIYDLNRLEIKKGTVLKGIEMYQGRHRMARLETFPEKTKDQIEFLIMILKATRRIGRPMHMFRGLPVRQKSYFYFDAMPKVLKNLIGGNSLYLEQIPKALEELEMAQLIIETHGLGYDVLKLYADKSTRFKALCLIWSHLRSKEADRTKFAGKLYSMYDYFMEDNSIMKQEDNALVRLGKVATSIQKRPFGQTSASEELLVFKICFDTVTSARKYGQMDEESLIYAIAGELETNLVRKDKAASRNNRDGKNLIDGCLEVAQLFVKDIWTGLLNGQTPGQKNKRILSSIYRISFIKNHQKNSQTQNSQTQE